MPDAVYLKDGDGRFLAANNHAQKLFNLFGIAWLGKTDSELIIDNPNRYFLLQKVFEDDHIAWNEGCLLTYEKEFFDETGKLHVYDLRKDPIFFEDGRRKALIVIAREITDRKRDEINLRIANIAFEAQEGIVVTDARNHILRVNNAFVRLTGYSPEEVIGKTISILKSGRHNKEFYHDMWVTLKRDLFWQGEIWDRRKNGEIYPKWLTIRAVVGPKGDVNNYVGSFTDLSQTKESEEAIYRLAFYDPLTNLPNRRLFYDRYEQAQSTSARNGMYVAVLMIDLDNFKLVNDSKGHGVGDLLLVELANRLRSCIRQNDTLARLDGDEFVILLEGLHEDIEQVAIDIKRLGEKILDTLNQVFLLRDIEIQISASIGISFFIGGDMTVEESLRRADTAMYHSKDSGRNTLSFYDPYMQLVQETRVSLGYDLRQALSGNQLTIHYQPQVSTERDVYGFEALARWNHPIRGMILPSQFIPICEDSGLILSIGEWVLYNACKQLKSWEPHPNTVDWTIAVNVSAKQFHQIDFVENVSKILLQTGINPMRLKLELTESLVLQNIGDAIEKMSALRLLGVQFSLDDFGTGHSSLSALKKLPIDELKIDKSFIHDISTNQNDAIIVGTIIAMAKSLRLDIVAEGVETEEQFRCLKEIGCPAYQGYLFGKPKSVEEFKW
jgi:diguanylate cyclase (GGDEF)-like protein/PAS domain S-box-containing protein